MNIEIVTKNQCKEIVKEETKNHLKAIWNAIEQLESKMIQLADDVKVLRMQVEK